MFEWTKNNLVEKLTLTRWRKLKENIAIGFLEVCFLSGLEHNQLKENIASYLFQYNIISKVISCIIFSK
jgi:hypothetical protein